MRLPFLLAALTVGGCTHPLEIRNLDDYPAVSEAAPLERATTVGLVGTAPDASSRDLIRGIAAALGKYSAHVQTPYAPGSGPPPDAIARVTVTPQYKGSALNPLVTLPGALVLAPMWNGYSYEVDYLVHVLLTRGWDNAKIDSWEVPLTLDVRHADGVRLGGYDPDVTPQLMARVADPLADHVARDIVRRLNASELLWKLAAPPEAIVGAEPEIGSPTSVVVPVPVTTPESGAPPEAALMPSEPVPLPATPPAPAPPAAPPPAPVAQPVVLAKGMAARLQPGGVLRNRPQPNGTPIEIGRVTAVRLGSNVRNETGTWWYATAAGKNGWVREEDLTPAP